MKVDITTDKYGAETTFDIKESAGHKIIEVDDYQSVTTHVDSTCVDGGSCIFDINDSYRDGACYPFF